MTLIAFPDRVRPQAGEWAANELSRIVESLAPERAGGAIGGWEVDRTELGDPQLYVLGPPPGHDCILCLTRLGRVYAPLLIAMNEAPRPRRRSA